MTDGTGAGSSTVDEHGQLGGYVTDALDDQEREEFEAHMAECQVCAADARELAETFAELTFATQVTPPRALRDAVLGAVARVAPLPPLPAPANGAESGSAGPRHAAGPVPVDVPERVDPPARPMAPVPEAGVPGGAPEIGGPAPARSDRPAEVAATVTSLDAVRARRARRLLTLAVAAVTVVALALGGWVVTLRQQQQQQQQVADRQAQTARQQQQAAAEQARVTAQINVLLAARDAKVYPVLMQNKAKASYVVSKSLDRAVFIAPNVAGLSADEIYELWTTSNGNAFRPAGTFSGAGEQRVLIEGNVSDTVALAVTVEPNNGGAGSTEPSFGDKRNPFAFTPIKA